eukprot:maker-scaffold_22-snap-gene-1.47-mRNA-1 protein AED:0.09 eAED:0.10 QI:0/0.75/0.8/1/0/0/5/98/237
MTLLSFLGLATFFTGFHVLETISKLAAPKYILEENLQQWTDSVVGLFHHVSSCILSMYAIYFPTSAMMSDRMYGFSDSATFVVGYSFAYFCWDLSTCFRQGIKDPGTIIHAFVCALCYLFGQFPYLNYYGPRFLLFEISSIFMVLRKLLLLAGRRGFWVEVNQTLFGLSFFAVRILYGVKISFEFFQDTLDLIKNKKEHYKFPVYYYLIANIIINFLNVFWMILIIKKYLKQKKKLV